MVNNKPEKEKKEKKVRISNEQIYEVLVEIKNALVHPVREIGEAPKGTGFAPDIPANRGAIDAGQQPAQSSGIPIPYDFREAVESTLNKKFGIDIEYKQETAAFAFSILVPKEYSNAGEPHWQANGEDRRTRVIQNAMGVNGVREYAQLVYENFPQEIKSRIVFDRGTLL